MRFAIVDDLGTERTLLKERLARQLRQRGTEAELLEFDSGEAFLAAEEAQRFTAAFLDIYMDGLSGMDAAKELRKTDADCLLVFTTTSTDHALEGFQVRAFHYLVKPFSEAELSGLLDEMLAKFPRPEPILTVKVDGSDIHLRYRDIISAEHFATSSISAPLPAKRLPYARVSRRSQSRSKRTRAFLFVAAVRSSIWRMLPIFRMPPSV